MKAWHFVNTKLRDGRDIPEDGVTLYHPDKLILCKSGLHASKKLQDALEYAPGRTLCRVQLGGTILEDTDKVVASERTILWRIDADDLLLEFARACALEVAHLWNPPEVVLEYLSTGDESLRDAARDAARSAARVAEASAEASTWVAEAAARSAAEASTAEASAARAAAWGAAAWDAAWAAAWDAAWAAAWAAARNAADAAAWDGAAWGAARDAAWAAARDRQNTLLETMVHERRNQDAT